LNRVNRGEFALEALCPSKRRTARKLKPLRSRYQSWNDF